MWKVFICVLKQVSLFWAVQPYFGFIESINTHVFKFYYDNLITFKFIWCMQIVNSLHSTEFFQHETEAARLALSRRDHACVRRNGAFSNGIPCLLKAMSGQLDAPHACASSQVLARVVLELHKCLSKICLSLIKTIKRINCLRARVWAVRSICETHCRKTQVSQPDFTWVNPFLRHRMSLHTSTKNNANLKRHKTYIVPFNQWIS